MEGVSPITYIIIVVHQISDIFSISAFSNNATDLESLITGGTNSREAPFEESLLPEKNSPNCSVLIFPKLKSPSHTRMSISRPLPISVEGGNILVLCFIKCYDNTLNINMEFISHDVPSKPRCRLVNDTHHWSRSVNCCSFIGGAIGSFQYISRALIAA